MLVVTVLNYIFLINNIVDEAETIIKNRLNDSVIIDKDGPIVATPRWLLEYNYVEDVETAREPHRMNHISLVRDMKADGKIIMGGAHKDMKGAHIIFNDETSLDEFVKQDPYVLEGVVTSFEKKEWTVVVD